MKQAEQRLPLLPMEPYYRTVVWGGRAICALKGVASRGEAIGESWEVSDLPDAESAVSHSAAEPFAGKPLSEIIEQYGDSLLGKRLMRLYGPHFPLLVKIIDARQDLSIQVHPDDYLAARRHNGPGKTELWYTLSADVDAFIYSGLKRTVTPEVLRKHIAKGSVTTLLARFKPVRGDYFYLPAGRIHSIGAGTLVLEFQQPSDITYRIYDYQRPGLDGKLRTLHVDEALEAIDFRVHDDYRRHIDSIPDREQVLQECPHFIATLISLENNAVNINVMRYRSPRILVCTLGTATVRDDRGETVKLRQGHTLIVPATTPYVTVSSADGSASEVVTAYIP